MRFIYNQTLRSFNGDFFKDIDQILPLLVKRTFQQRFLVYKQKSYFEFKLITKHSALYLFLFSVILTKWEILMQITKH